ncbi:MAG: hypothetical protein Q4G48_07645 [Bacteroidia bacterium]|nr:hypothetical protein [Bacteroidia bacterium]
MKTNNSNIKSELLKKLKAENAFWSYNTANTNRINDRMLIVKTLVHLDLPEIDMLFKIFPFNEIKKVWREELAISGEYYHNLNRFLAWWYFDIKNPDSYLKSVVTKHINSFV